MNQKAAYSVLFCALLASTFVHELKAKGVAPVSSRHNHKALLSRAGSSQTCELTCTWVQNVNTLNITLEVIDNLLVVANYSANAAFVLDVSAQIVLVLNGTSGAGVAINIAKQIGVSFASGLWVGGSVELSSLITSKLSAGLTVLWNLSGAVSFTLAAITTAHLTIIAGIIVKLIKNVADQVTETPKYALELLLTVASSLIKLINGSLHGILALVIEKISLVTDLPGLLVTLTSLGNAIVVSVGSLENLTELAINLKIAEILAAKNGLVALANLILQLGVNASVAAKLGAYLSSQTNVLAIVAGLGGGLSAGVNGVLAIAASLALLANNSGSLELVITKVIQVSIGNSLGASLSSEFSASLSAVLSAVAHVSANSSLSVVVDVITSLKSDSLTINGLNISSAVSTLLSIYVGASVAPLAAILIVVQLIKTIKAEYLLAVSLLLVLVAKLSFFAGLKELVALGFAISLSFNLVSILKSSLNIIFSLITGQITTVLSSLPGIGTIVNSIAASWSGGLSVFASLLTGGKSLILAWFQVATGVSLGASSSALASVASITQYATSVTHYTALSYSASFAVSVSVSSSASGGVSVSG